MGIILAYLLGGACAPFIWLFLVLLIIKAFIDDFWGTVETILHIIACIFGVIWELGSCLFMFVWDISYVGPILALAGVAAILYFFSGPIFALLRFIYSLVSGILKAAFWICFVPVCFVLDHIFNIPKAGLEEEEAKVGAMQNEQSKEDSSSHE